MGKYDEILHFYKLNTIIGNVYIAKSEKGLRNIELIEDKWKDFNKKYKLIENKDICKNEIEQINMRDPWRIFW